MVCDPIMLLLGIQDDSVRIRSTSSPPKNENLINMTSLNCIMPAMNPRHDGLVVV